MNDQPRPAEVQAHYDSLRRHVGVALQRCRTKDDCFRALRSALGIDASVYKAVAKRNGFTAEEANALSFANATIGAIVRTLEASPLYDTPHLADQLLHALSVHLGESNWMEVKESGGDARAPSESTGAGD